MIGKAEDYTKYLVLKHDEIRARFVKDKTYWDEEVEIAEKLKSEHDATMVKFMAEQKKLFESFFPNNP